MKMEGDALTKRILEANPVFQVSCKLPDGSSETISFSGPDADKKSIAYQEEMSEKGYSSQCTVSATLRMSAPYAYMPGKSLHQKR